MKLSRVTLLIVVLIVPQICLAQTTSKANRAWRPFFNSFRTAVKNRDKDALMTMMSPQFYYMSSGGDENGNSDTRDEAFEYWETSTIDMWKGLDGALALDAVTNTAMPQFNEQRSTRISPPAANNLRAIRDHKFDWY